MSCARSPRTWCGLNATRAEVLDAPRPKPERHENPDLVVISERPNLASDFVITVADEVYSQVCPRLMAAPSRAPYGITKRTKPAPLAVDPAHRTGSGEGRSSLITPCKLETGGRSASAEVALY